LRLQISMHDPQPMQHLDPLTNASKHPFNIV
jgi:hypothetical protein